MKRFLSILMAATLLLGLLPAASFAEGQKYGESPLLAAEVAPVIRNDGRELAMNLTQQYQQIDLPTAQNNDGSEARMERQDLRRDSRLLAVRGGLSG